MHVTIYHWIGFNLLILLILMIDLWRFYRRPHAVEVPEALLVSVGWIFLAFLFNGWVYFAFGKEPALNFFTGYLVEKSLSIDNLFIFLLIFAYFKVPEQSQHQVLFYGVLGAILMRALLIGLGIALVNLFTWIFPLFGLFLIITGIRLIFKTEEGRVVERSFTYQWLYRWIPITPTYHGENFWIREQGRWMATPLLVVLALIEVSDLIFALDSVPAILGITTEPFIVYTSNIFAILGLRSLFFALQGVIKRFYFIHYSLAFILVFIGCKMVIANYWHIPTTVTLAVVIGALVVGMIASYLIPNRSHN